MQLPFTTGQFLDLFGQYNNGIFPAQIFFYLLAVAISYLLVRKTAVSSKYFLFVLCFFWLWTGVVYQIIYFARINPIAKLFGAFFIVQGVLFIYYAVKKQELVFKHTGSAYNFTGWILIIYGLIIYPLLGYMLGHHYPNSPVLGAPCPTVIFTFGLLLFIDGKLPKTLLVIPVLWSLLGFTAALKLTMIEDFGLLISAILTLALVLYRDRSSNVKSRTSKETNSEGTILEEKTSEEKTSEGKAESEALKRDV